MNRLNQIDTNLLIALDILLEERHVTRAARRLGVTQPAMSQTLQRLRTALDDPLLVRSGSTMIPTPRAEALAGPLHAALQALERTLAVPAPFEPRTATRTFRLAMLDVYSISVLPKLLNTLGSAGDGLSLDITTLETERVWEQLRTGEIELAIISQEVPADISCVPFMRERMVAMVREGHPLLDAPITTERYVAWPHVVFRISGRGEHPIDRRLHTLGVKRRVLGRSPFFLSTPWVLMASNTIVTMPSSAAHAVAETLPVRLFEPPFGASMEYNVSLAWPNYLENDQAHRWFRTHVLEAGRKSAARGKV